MDTLTYVKTYIADHKEQILEYLQTEKVPSVEISRHPVGHNAQDIWQSLSEDERMELEERAAIMEYDGGLSRFEAETQALKMYLQKTNKCLQTELD